MAKSTSQGKCELCGSVFGKAAMTRHLKSCSARHSGAGSTSTKKPKLLHILVEGHRQPEYWLHIEASANDRLAALDEFLRATWLECCGHMSTFTIGGASYCAAGDDGFCDHDTSARLDNVLAVGAKFIYEYDMGSTTTLTLKVLVKREDVALGKGVTLLARNEPPVIPCACGKPAAVVCSQCSYEASGWLCKACAGDHECGEEVLLPVVNSPRAGVCAYAGPV